MTNIRQLIQKGDPMLRIQLPEVLIKMLQHEAKKNRRRPQDQLIKSLAETFKREQAFANSFPKFLPDLQEIYQNPTSATEEKK